MSYYNDLITEKSWRFLQDLKRNHDFILIGGWAVYLYTKALKSRDIPQLDINAHSYSRLKTQLLKQIELSSPR